MRRPYVALGIYNKATKLPVDLHVPHAISPSDNDSSDSLIFDALYKFVSENKDGLLKWKEMSRFYRLYPKHEARFKKLKENICAVKTPTDGGMLIWVDDEADNGGSRFVTI